MTAAASVHCSPFTVHILQFQFFKITAIHALGLRHRDKCVGVDAVDDLHHMGLVGLVHHDDEHLLLLVAVAALGVEQRGTAAHLGGDGVANLLVLGGEDHNLIRLLVAVQPHL